MEEESRSYMTREIPGIICLFLAVTVFLALVSHNPSDPSFLRHSTADSTPAVSNYIGIIGAYLSGLLIELFGLSSFWTVLALFILMWRFFRGHSFDYTGLVILGLGLLLVAGSAGLSMIFPRLKIFWAHTPGGGLLGDVLARELGLALGPVGAGLLVGALALVALILSTGLSLIRGAVVLGRGLVKTKAALDESQTKRREKAQRSKRLEEVLERQKHRVAPKIKEKQSQEASTPAKPKQEVFEFVAPGGGFRLPPLDLLDEPEKGQGGMSPESLMANARLLEKKLTDFNVEGEVIEVSTGPVITMYEYKPAPGVKISKVAGLADDLAMNMQALAIRIVAPLPGKPVIGIEIPNPKREIVYLKEVISSPAFQESNSPLAMALGVDILGQPEVADLQKMPHLLIAGATGSGKSVALNAIIMSILFKARPDEVRFLMIDPKRVELAVFKDLPHLIYPVVCEPKDANQALKWAVADMEQRYQLLAEKGVRNIEAYNKKIMKEQAQSRLTPPADSEGE
ncbi:MAG: DNA translocase FtsK 4TM domain-containing protein, partial [Pseudomonadota bacterium]